MLDRSGDNPGVWLTNLAAIESITGRHRQAAQMVERLLGLRVLPDLFRLIGWNHLMLAQLRERTLDGVGAEAALRAARAVFLRIGDRQGLAVADAVARR